MINHVSQIVKSRVPGGQIARAGGSNRACRGVKPRAPNVKPRKSSKTHTVCTKALILLESYRIYGETHEYLYTLITMAETIRTET